MKLTRAEWLALSAAIANVGLWLQAGLMVEAANLPVWLAEPVEIFSGAVGIVASGALGVAMSFGLFVMIHAAASMPPTIKRQRAGQEVEHVNRRFWYLVGASGVVLVAELYLLAVVVAALVNGVTLAEQVGGWLPVWSVGRVLAAALVLAGLSLVAKGQAAAKPDEAKPSRMIAKPIRFVCASCGFVAKSQAALNGHKRKHSGTKAKGKPE